MQKKTINKNKKRISPTMAAIISSLALLIGGFFLSYDFLKTKKIYAYDIISEKLFLSQEKEAAEIKNLEEEKSEENITEVVTETPVVQEPIITAKPESNDSQQEPYLGYLTIPKINFKKGFFSKESKQNNIEKNIYVIEESTYPDVVNGNLIIIGHSGIGWKAFFKELHNVEKGDIAIVTYQGKKYTYTITKIYKQEKDGTIAIYRDYNKTTLTLITCTINDAKTQTVYIAELTNIE